MLTDLLYDILAEEHFEGHIADGTLEIITINEYPVFQRVYIIISLFIFLWAVISFAVPLIRYCTNSLRTKNIPKINKERLLDIYKECRSKAITLQEQIRNVRNKNSQIILFVETCQIIMKLHKTFCSGKKENNNVIDNSFRTGSTVYDIDTRVSKYEFLAVIGILQEILTLSYNNSFNASDKLQKADYDQMVSFLNELQCLHVNE